MIGLLLPMMYMLVVVIVVPICIVSSKRKKNQRNSPNNTNNNHTYTRPGYVHRNPQRNVQGNVPGNIWNSVQTGASGSMQRTGTGNVSGRNVQAGKDNRRLSEQKDAEDKGSGSTTEYLEKKAMEDQREHAVEKMEEQRRVNAKYGNIPVAARHILGDPVPAGRKIICCKYCGAENEVKIGYGGSLACYFCRTKL